MAEDICYQINLQQSIGGGEVYTRFFTATLQKLGWHTQLFVNRRAEFWHGLGLAGATIVPVRTLGEIETQIGGTRPLVITHNILAPSDAARFAHLSVLTGIIHMPLYERVPAGLPYYRLLFGVSGHVISSALFRGLTNVHAQPLYGIADLAPRGESAPGGIRRGSPYDADRRKFRDRLLGAVAPLMSFVAGQRMFAKRAGLTLGIVSRITPIKQLPLMFAILAPVIARFPQVNLEIFGSGGYASMRDFKRALAPIRNQVRFWGQQEDVAAIYPQLDYVLSGLPEKEALGLNLIEAQCCGTPVLAVNAPPFTETVVDGATGWLFEDPRQDRGVSFGALLDRILSGAARPQPGLAAAHLARFTQEAYSGRVKLAIDAALASD